MVKLRTRLALYLSLVAGVAIVGGGPGGGSSPPAPPAPPAAPAPTAPTAPAPPAAPSAGPTGPTAAGGFGRIKGRVLVTRKTERPEVVKVANDVEVCGKEHDPASLKLGGDGALEACVVYVKGPAAPADWKKSGTYEIDQKGCHYSPRVLVVPLGETVTFKSSDPIAHNVRTSYKSFNLAVTKDGPQKLLCDAPDFAAIGCSIHPFMSGLLVVAENPWYALTDASGAYKLEKVPAGTWTITARHEVLGKHVKQGTPVTVEADKETVLDLKFE